MVLVDLRSGVVSLLVFLDSLKVSLVVLNLPEVAGGVLSLFSRPFIGV